MLIERTILIGKTLDPNKACSWRDQELKIYLPPLSSKGIKLRFVGCLMNWGNNSLTL